jgi:hypothetical protein
MTDSFYTFPHAPRFHITDRNRWDREIQQLKERLFRLRFELGEESLSNVSQTVPRFVQAFDRARHVGGATFVNLLIIAAVGCSVQKKT